jgi:hypothetical protein
MSAIEDYLLSGEMGVMPYSGGIREQPHTVFILFTILRSASVQAQKEEMDKR